MHFTRFEINPQRRAARAMLASPQRMHAAVLAGFPESRDEHAAGRILWRLDEGRHDVVLYVVSPGKPDLTHLVETIGRPTYGWQTRDYGPFLDRLAAGDRWAFRLLANPVHNIRPTEGGRGKRVGHITVAQQTDWFLRQAERHGLAVLTGALGEPDVAVRSRRTLRFARGPRTVTLSTAVFEGILRVEDPAALRAALVGGIGPGKGYGCGLLTLAAP
ncbi:type I-E CRISPR-associated protein Cas6/Cse3/CasE [Pseudonocardia hispaniensis]|uniref:Type I-E CRISPR-associated protein Cas6/Cse3/CasE n=1 Tax=Pseudonocardia hispaniensis TaxID=904933 RepID=A0ABW1J7C5_9PSEU